METQLRRLKLGRLIFIGLLSLVLAGPSVSWAQIVVTTLADNGPGSLRQAILDGNANPAADIITFVPRVGRRYFAADTSSDIDRHGRHDRRNWSWSNSRWFEYACRLPRPLDSV